MSLNKTGILNIAGNRISRYELALKVAKLYNLKNNVDKKKNIDMKAKRPFDSTLNIEKAKKLIDFNFYSTEENLKLMVVR